MVLWTDVQTYCTGQSADSDFGHGGPSLDASVTYQSTNRGEEDLTDVNGLDIGC